VHAAAWHLDDDVLDALQQPENGLLLRRWSAIVAALSQSPTISKELERRTARSASEDQDEEEEDS
jgi:hypothetical protein